MIKCSAIVSGGKVDVSTVVHGTPPDIAMELIGITANVLIYIKPYLEEGATLEEIARHIMDTAVEEANRRTQKAGGT